MSRHDDEPQTMFVNPLLAILFEAGILQVDIARHVPEHQQKHMQDRLLRISKLAEAMHKKNPLPLAVYLDDGKPPPGPVDKEYKFPVIRGGKP